MAKSVASMKLFVFCTQITFILLHLHCTSGGVTRGDTFYFRSWPEDSRPCAGSPLRLACSVSDSTFINLRWTKDKKPISLSSRISTNDIGLLIRRVLPQDSGSYACIAHNTSSGFALTSLPANIQVLWIGTKTEVSAVGKSKEKGLRPGQSIVLRCRIPGGPGLAYTWLRNGEQLVNISTNGRKRLSLAKVRGRQDNGVYSCNAALSSSKLTRNDPIEGGDRPLCDGYQKSRLSAPYVLNVPDPRAPALETLPKPILAVGGQSASFTCGFERGTEVKWKYLDTSQEGRITILNDTLIITNVTPSDEGFYQCTGSHPVKPFVQTFGAQLNIAYLSSVGPQFEPSPDEDRRLVVAQGSTVRVKCLPPEGLPVPKLSWTDEGGKTVASSGSLRTEVDQIVIEGASVDGGEEAGKLPWQREMKFHCTATNIAGSATSHITILITRRPILKSGPSPQHAEESDTVKLRCEVEGADKHLTEVHWTKNGHKVRVDSQRITTWGLGASEEDPSVTSSGPSQITELRVGWLQANDSGKYACHVITKGHTPIVSQGTKLEVFEKLRFWPVPRNGRVKVGGSTSIPCRAHSHVAPTITWKKLMPQGSVGSLPSGMVNIKGNLTIPRALKEYDGWYVCSAHTPHHRPINASIRLLVTEFPRAYILAGEIVTAVQGEAYALRCRVTGQPPPHVSWRRTPPIADSWLDDKNGTLSSLRVSKRDEGLYTCQATNLVGTATAHVTIAVAAGMMGRKQLQRTAGIAVGCAGIYLGLMVVLLLYCRHRRRRYKNPPTPPPPILTPAADTARRMSDSFQRMTENTTSTSVEEPAFKIDSSKAKEEHDLSIIYSSRMYDADAELEVPLNIPRRPRKLRRKDRRKFKKSISMYPRGRTRSSTAVMLGPDPGSMEDTSWGDQYNSEFELRCSRSSAYSDHLQAAYEARWSDPFHSSRPPEPTSLDPML